MDNNISQDKNYQIEQLLKDYYDEVTRDIRTEKSEIIYQQIIRLDDNEKYKLFNDIFRYDFNEEFAIQKANEVIDKYNDFSYGYIIKARVLCRLHLFEDALTCMHRAIELDSNNYIAWLELARVLKYLCKYNDAMEHINKAIELNPYSDTCLVIKASIMNITRNYVGAIGVLDEALRLNPQNDCAWNNKGFSLNCIGKYKEAIKALNESTRLNHNNDSAWNNKGYALHWLGRYNEAIEVLDEGLKIDPWNHSTWSNKCSALYKLGKIDESNFCGDVGRVLNSFSRTSITKENKDILKKVLLKKVKIYTKESFSRFIILKLLYSISPKDPEIFNLYCLSLEKRNPRAAVKLYEENLYKVSQIYRNVLKDMTNDSVDIELCQASLSLNKNFKLLKGALCSLVNRLPPKNTLSLLAIAAKIVLKGDHITAENYTQYDHFQNAMRSLGNEL